MLIPLTLVGGEGEEWTRKQGGGSLTPGEEKGEEAQSQKPENDGEPLTLALASLRSLFFWCSTDVLL